jgi:capsular exopolysaccharide synthesis family protein
MSELIHKNGKGGKEMSRFEYVPTYSMSESENGSNFLDPKYLLAIILRYKWLLAVCLILGAAGGWYYAGTLTPVYQSSGTMIISTGGTDDELSRIISQTTGVGTSSTLANEIQVLRSREFARQIALSSMEESPGGIDDFPVLWNRDEEGSVSRASEGAVTGRIQGSLNVQRREQDSEIIQVSFQSSSPVESAHIVNKALELYVERSTYQNRRAAESTAQFLENEKEEIRQRLERSEQRLKEYMDRTGIVRMDEQSSAMVTQQTAIEMEIQQVELDLRSVLQALENHEQQLDRLKPGLTEQFSEALGPRIRNSQEQLALYEGERTLILTRNPGVRDREQTPPRLKFLDEEIERVKDEIRTLSSQLFTEDDEYMGMDSEERAQMVATIQTRITELNIQKNQYESRITALEQRKNEIDQNFDTLPAGMIELARLQRDVTLNEELFVNVSRQYADMSVLKQSQFGFGRIIDTALVPGSPFSPNKKIILILGIMLGGVLAAGIIFVSEFADNSVNSIEMVQSAHLPLLAAIPVLDKVSKRNKKSFQNGSGYIPDELVLLRDRANLASEAIRRLKNNLTYQYGERPPKTIAVTSAEKSDGKSTIVSNLAAAFAEDGFKTLVVDVDFRRPKLHTYFGCENAPGLTDYLAGRISIRNLIKDTDLNKLKIITSGTTTRTPDAIVSSKEFREFLAGMDNIFDTIIFDTPPFGIISDSTALLKKAEATILVAKYRKTNRGVLQKTLEELERIDANICGIVVNSFDYKKEAIGNYGSGYYKAMYESYQSYA